VSAGALTKRLKCLPVLGVSFDLVLFMFWSGLAKCSALAQRADRLVCSNVFRSCRYPSCRRGSRFVTEFYCVSVNIVLFLLSLVLVRLILVMFIEAVTLTMLNVCTCLA
jgi:hypothetical protein